MCECLNVVQSSRIQLDCIRLTDSGPMICTLFYTVNVACQKHPEEIEPIENRAYLKRDRSRIDDDDDDDKVTK